MAEDIDSGTNKTYTGNNLAMSQNYNYRIEVEDKNNVAIQKGTFKTYCSGTTNLCNDSSICRECVKGSHNAYIEIKSTSYSTNTMCLGCKKWSGQGSSYATLICPKCNPLGNGGINQKGYWTVPNKCTYCGMTAAEQKEFLNHPCPTCSGTGYKMCTVHNKYGVHYYCSHSNAGTKHQ